MSIPVICDRCRATGVSGESGFTHLGDLLEFEPVPRKTKRADGWTPERQRAFVAALSATGSKRQAALAIGMASYGVDQLLKADGNESFKAAVERALAIAAQNGSMKIAQGVADAAARNAQLAPPPSRLRGIEPAAAAAPAVPADALGLSEEQKWDFVYGIGARFMRKVAAEREARLAGEIVAADFYLRQLTFLEVLLDLGSAELGFSPYEVMREIRRADVDLMRIVSTPFSDWMDASRRLWWMQEGEPERPPHPDIRFLERRRSIGGDCATYTDQHAYGALATPARGYTQEQWEAMDNDSQREARQRQFEQDADEQREWEAAAHRDYESRRDSATRP